jgi:hypothetical protein
MNRKEHVEYWTRRLAKINRLAKTIMELSPKQAGTEYEYFHNCARNIRVLTATSIENARARAH